jgi:glycosyltransferase involved in cell wall biosynthesis
MHNSTPSEGGSFTYESNVSNYLQGAIPDDVTFTDFYKGRLNQISNNQGLYRATKIELFLSMIRQSALGFEILKLLKLDKSRFEKLLLGQDFDYVYFLSPNPSALSILNIPMINTVWDLGHRHFPEISEFSFEGRFQKREYFYQNVLKRSSHVVVDCEKTKEEVSSFYGVKHERITPLGLFPKEIKHTCSHDCSQSPFLFYPAQFWSHKNHAILVEAFSLLKPDYPYLKLFFTGTDKGMELATKQLVVRLGLESSVLFLGFVTSEEMSMYFHHAEITVFPSTLGYTNLPPLESLLSGTPVIASDVHQFDFDLPHQIYRQVPAMNPDIWAQAIREMLKQGKVKKDFFDLPQLIHGEETRKLFIDRVFRFPNRLP